MKVACSSCGRTKATPADAIRRRSDARRQSDVCWSGLIDERALLSREERYSAAARAQIVEMRAEIERLHCETARLQSIERDNGELGQLAGALLEMLRTALDRAVMPDVVLARMRPWLPVMEFCVALKRRGLTKV